MEDRLRRHLGRRPVDIGPKDDAVPQAALDVPFNRDVGIAGDGSSRWTHGAQAGVGADWAISARAASTPAPTSTRTPRSSSV